MRLFYFVDFVDFNWNRLWIELEEWRGNKKVIKYKRLFFQ